MDLLALDLSAGGSLLAGLAYTGLGLRLAQTGRLQGVGYCRWHSVGDESPRAGGLGAMLKSP